MIICFPGKISRGKQDWPYSKITTGVAKLLEGGVYKIRLESQNGNLLDNIRFISQILEN